MLEILLLIILFKYIIIVDVIGIWGDIMSLSKIIDITCPKCNTKQSFKIWQSINVTEDRTLKDMVFSQELFKFKCSYCGVTSIIEYPFIYHDAEKKFFVYFDPSKRFENVIETPEYKTKTTGEYLELLEVVRILEDGIDEKKVAAAKEELLNKFRNNEKLKHINKIYYSGAENEKLVFFVPEINGKILF